MNEIGINPHLIRRRRPAIRLVLCACESGWGRASSRKAAQPRSLHLSASVPTPSSHPPPHGEGACKESMHSFPENSMRTVWRSSCHLLTIHENSLSINIYGNSLNMCLVCDCERIIDINYFV